MQAGVGVLAVPQGCRCVGPRACSAGLGCRGHRSICRVPGLKGELRQGNAELCLFGQCSGTHEYIFVILCMAGSRLSCVQSPARTIARGRVFLFNVLPYQAYGSHV